MKKFKKLIILTLLMGLSLSSSAQQPDPSVEDEANFTDEAVYSFLYYQKELQTNDTLGDIYLCNSMLKIMGTQMADIIRFKSVGNGILTKKIDEAKAKYPELVIPIDRSNPTTFATYEWAQEMDIERTEKIQGCKIKKPTKHRPFTVDSMTNMLKQVIHEESSQYPVHPGEIHKWSFKGKNKLKCAMLKAVPKMLVMLSLGVSYRFAKTGQEESLAQKIKYHPPRSLYPHDIFRMSYKLNKGNIYLTILTIENLLSRHWTDINREARMVTTRLAHITNDPYADNFGTWYHLWGVMLFGYLHGSATAWTVGTIEGLGSSLMSGFKAEVQENKVNRLGARVGGRLKKAFRKKRAKGLEDFIPSEKYTHPTYYLNLLEFNCERDKKGSS